MADRMPLGAVVYERIRDDIVRGVLPGGQRLSEQSLVKRYGASRTPVREALRRLEAEHAITRLAPGTVAVPELSAADARNLYETRAVLEGLVARQVSGRISERDAATLSSAVRKIRIAAEAGDAESAVFFSTAFHTSLISLSGNAYVAHSLRAYETSLARYRLYSSLAAASVPHLVQDAEEHGQILDAIRAGDAGHAEVVMRAHILTGLKKVEIGLQPQVPGGSPPGGRSRRAPGSRRRPASGGTQ